MLNSHTATRFTFNLRAGLGTDIQKFNHNSDGLQERQATARNLISSYFPHPFSSCRL